MPEPSQITAEPSLVNTTHLIYALHALSLLIGITSAATIIGAFVFGVPSIIAIVINYLKREEARGTYLESHFRWQIRTSATRAQHPGTLQSAQPALGRPDVPWGHTGRPQ